jgi:hypothetical protein
MAAARGGHVGFHTISALNGAAEITYDVAPRALGPGMLGRVPGGDAVDFEVKAGTQGRHDRAATSGRSGS